MPRRYHRFRVRPRNARHSSWVNRSTGPPGSMLSRTPIPRGGPLATSTQLPLARLAELLRHCVFRWGSGPEKPRGR